MNNIVRDEENQVLYVLKRPKLDMPKPRKLEDILGVHIGGPYGRREVCYNLLHMIDVFNLFRY